MKTKSVGGGGEGKRSQTHEHNKIDRYITEPNKERQQREKHLQCTSLKGHYEVGERNIKIN